MVAMLLHTATRIIINLRNKKGHRLTSHWQCTGVCVSTCNMGRPLLCLHQSRALMVCLFRYIIHWSTMWYFAIKAWLLLSWCDSLRAQQIIRVQEQEEATRFLKPSVWPQPVCPRHKYLFFLASVPHCPTLLKCIFLLSNCSNDLAS